MPGFGAVGDFEVGGVPGGGAPSTTEARPTQVFAEVLRTDADRNTLLTQEYAEVLRSDADAVGAVRSTQEFAEVLRTDADMPPAGTLLTQEYAEVLRTDADLIGTVRSTQEYAEVLRADADLGLVARVTEIYVETLIQDFPVAPHSKKRRVITAAQN